MNDKSIVSPGPTQGLDLRTSPVDRRENHVGSARRTTAGHRIERPAAACPRSATRTATLLLVVLVVAMPAAAHAPGAAGQEPQDSLGLAQDSAGLEEDLEPVTDERALQDETIRNQLQAVFDRVPDLADVEVTVDAGVVHLEGTVLRSENRVRAGELASQMEGVLFLDNRIRESTSLERQLQPTWTRLRNLGYGAIAKVPLIVVALLIVALAAVLGSWLGRWGGPKALRFGNPFLQALAERVLRLVLILAGLLLALDLLNATALVGALVGTAGLAGLALGFAFRDIVENYLAGTILALRQPFEKNDHIRVDTFEGKVVRLTARETILMTLEGNHVRVPNALILRNPMVNFTRNPLRRFQFEAGVGTEDDLVLARQVAVEALLEVEGVLQDPRPQALVTTLGDSTVTMRFMAWVDQRQVDFERVRSEAIRSVKVHLEDKGLNLPSPEFMIRLDGNRPAGMASGEIAILPPESASEEARAVDAGKPSVSRDASPVGAAPGAQPDAPKSASAARAVRAPADVSVDHALDKQIEEDRRISDEPDLLERSDPARKRQ